jgi:hypothetical protein
MPFVRSSIGHAIDGPHDVVVGGATQSALFAKVTEVCVRYSPSLLMTNADRSAFTTFASDVQAIALHPTLDEIAVCGLADGKIVTLKYEHGELLQLHTVQLPNVVGRAVDLTFVENNSDAFIVAGCTESSEGSNFIVVAAQEPITQIYPRCCRIKRIGPGRVAMSTGSALFVGRLEEDGFTFSPCQAIKELRGTRFVDVSAVESDNFLALTNAGFLVSYNSTTGTIEKWMDCKVCPAVQLCLSPSLTVVSGRIARCFDSTSWSFLGKAPSDVVPSVAQSFFSGMLAPPSVAAVATDGSRLTVFGPRGEERTFVISASQALSKSKARIDFTLETVVASLPADDAARLRVVEANGVVCYATDARCMLFQLSSRGTVMLISSIPGTFAANAVCAIGHHFAVGAENVCRILSHTGCWLDEFPLSGTPLFAATNALNHVALSFHDRAELWTNEKGNWEIARHVLCDAAVTKCVGFLMCGTVVCWLTDTALVCWNDDVHTYKHSGASGIRPCWSRDRALWVLNCDVVSMDPMSGRFGSFPSGLRDSIEAMQVVDHLEFLIAVGGSRAAVVCLKNAVTLHTVDLPSRSKVLGIAAYVPSDSVVFFDAAGRCLSIELLLSTGDVDNEPVRRAADNAFEGSVAASVSLTPMKTSRKRSAVRHSTLSGTLFAAERQLPRERHVDPTVAAPRARSVPSQLISPLEESRLAHVPVQQPTVHIIEAPDDADLDIVRVDELMTEPVPGSFHQSLNIIRAHATSAADDSVRLSIAADLLHLADEIRASGAPSLSAAAEMEALREEVRHVRLENVRISQQNDEILVLLRRLAQQQ